MTKTKALFAALLAVSVLPVARVRAGLLGVAPAAAQEKAGAEAQRPEQTQKESRVPAYQEDEESLKNPAPTLRPERFKGETRRAYKAAREIPRTLAQLPCYCYCDEIGHKSLHSCFVSEHAAHCGRCLEEALLAHRLEKKQGLSPAQIRERIIAMYTGK